MKIAVTGATGRQGGAVASHLLRRAASVRALVRDPGSAAARSLAARGVEVVAADQADPAAVQRALEGVDGVFGVQPLLTGRPHTELAYGRTLAGAAKSAGVRHFVYSSVLGADDAPDVPHFAAKAAVEMHLRATGLPHTILRPAGFMENLLMPIVAKGIAKGKLTTPAAIDPPQPMIAVDDIGAFAALVFLDREKYLGKTVPLVGDVASVRQQAEILGRVLGRPVKAAKLPGLITWLALGRDLYKMFRWADRRAAAQAFDIDALRAEHHGLTTFSQWCERQFGDHHSHERELPSR